jgi:hypothetical protein
MWATRKTIEFVARYNHINKDSYDTLEEILKIANDLGVDLALQSGDLFHDLFPSQNCLCSTLKIFEEQVFGEKDHNFKYYAQEGVDHSFMNLLSGTPNFDKLPRKSSCPSSVSMETTIIQ